MKLNRTCNLQHQHSLCDKGSPNVYPHRCCITPVRLQCLLAESRHWMEKELVPELAAECAFEVSAQPPGVQNRLQMNESCTGCGQRAQSGGTGMIVPRCLTCSLCDPESQSAKQHQNRVIRRACRHNWEAMILTTAEDASVPRMSLRRA